MATTIGVLVALTSLLSVLLGALADGIGTDCSLKGFGSSLLCSSCDELKRFELSELRDECLKCCQKTGSNNEQKFSGAILEVCGCKLGRFPHIQGFVKGNAPSQFPSLKIKYMRGADPTLKLLDDNQAVVDTLSIDKWDSNTLEEFLKEKLQ
uniref:Selenoprotein F n=1 Tax=Amphimedon queenslandica TaxID=400682 RepID=A0AAN0IC48_AMPQE